MGCGVVIVDKQNFVYLARFQLVSGYFTPYNRKVRPLRASGVERKPIVGGLWLITYAVLYLNIYCWLSNIFI